MKARARRCRVDLYPVRLSGPKAPQSSGSPSAHSFGLTRPSLLILAMKLLVLALSLASALGFGYFLEPAPTGAPTGTCMGSCYDSATHIVSCNVPDVDCDGYWYAPGYMSDYSGCCHCECSCDHAAETATDSCTYYG